MYTEDELIDEWKKADGWYVCPKDAQGTRLGKLVGYAGRYEADDGTKKQYVGDIYANFAKVDCNTRRKNIFADAICHLLRNADGINYDQIDWVLGAPLGGIQLAGAVAQVIGCLSIFAEKEVTALKTATEREQSILVLKRYELAERSWGLIGEDVVNNYSTTEQLLGLVKAAGGRVGGIISALNRSPTNVYKSPKHGPIPVISAIWKPMPEYRQDDPEVAQDIARGNVALDPKKEWSQLMRFMEIGSAMTPNTVL